MELLELFVFLRVIAPLPSKVRDFVGRANLGGRIAMAIQAEGHAERLGVVNFIHLVDLRMALNATDAAVDVNGMIEIDEIRDAVDLHPFDWFAAGGAFAN